MSPYLRRIERTEEEARRDYDDAIIAGLLIGLDALRLTAAKEQDRAATERGRLACASLIDALEQARLRLALADTDAVLS